VIARKANGPYFAVGCEIII